MKLKKKSVLHYYLTAIVINVVIPFLAVFSFQPKGEGQLIYVGISAWAGLHLIAFAMYFAIPNFYKSWEKKIAFIFPPLMGAMFVIMAWQLIFPVLFNIVLGSLFMWHYNNKILPQTQI